MYNLVVLHFSFSFFAKQWLNFIKVCYNLSLKKMPLLCNKSILKVVIDLQVYVDE